MPSSKDTKFVSSYKESIISNISDGENTIDAVLERGDLLHKYANFLSIVLDGYYCQRSIFDYFCCKLSEGESLIIRKKEYLKNLENKLNKLELSLSNERVYYEQGIMCIKQRLNFKKKMEQGKIVCDSSANQYYKEIKKMESYLADIGFHDDLKEDSIDNLKKDNEKIKDEINSLKQKLSVYEFEPNNESLGMFINTIKEELETLQEEFTNVLDTSRN